MKCVPGGKLDQAYHPMRLLSQPLSRRCLLAGAAAAAAGLGAPPRAPAQTTPDRLRLLHAQGAGGGTQASSPGSLLRYENSVPGPILRVKRGDELRVRLVNDLGAPTSVHWHGIRLPNAMDGVPQLTQPAVASGASFDYRFRPPDAGTVLVPRADRGPDRSRPLRRADRRGNTTRCR